MEDNKTHNNMPEEVVNTSDATETVDSLPTMDVASPETEQKEIDVKSSDISSDNTENYQHEENEGEVHHTLDTPALDDNEQAKIPAFDKLPINDKDVDEKNHNPHKPIGVIVISIFVALCLIGIAVYLYAKNQPKPMEDNSNAQTTEVKEEATTTDVDEVTTEIDKNIDGLDDSADFPDNELSDETLGL